MRSFKRKSLYILHLFLILSVLSSCKKKFDDNDYTAYFEGEILNPETNYVLFYKDDKLLDTLFLDKNNKFFKKFNSLTPGMYIYKHNPEYQYVYFDKNDSLNLRLNTLDFDHSIIFSGRGHEKNNFLMSLNTRNIVDPSKLYEYYDAPVEEFIKKLDSAYARRTNFYLRNKSEIGWDQGFDLYAKTMLELHFYSQKEIYPIAHRIRNHKDIRNELPKDYYDFRKRIEFNNENLIKFAAFTKYLAIMLNSEVEQSEIEFNSETNFDKNIEKLNIVDTLIQNEKVKNTILDNLAFMYLLDDQNISNNEKFLNRYFELSTDKDQHNEILQIQKSIQNLKKEKRLPDIGIVDKNGKEVSINKLINKPTIIFIWSKEALEHFDAAHKKALQLLEKMPNIQIIAINIDADQAEWKKQIEMYPHGGIIELRATDFEKMKDKWIITKIHRSMILNSDGTIKNAFVNLFDTNIDKKIN